MDNIDHAILLTMLRERMLDKRITDLLRETVESFSCQPGRGLPLGNLISQLFVNIYMTPFDQFVKHQLKERYYLRYADDFVIFSPDKSRLQAAVSCVSQFLHEKLQLELHPQKVSIHTLASGVDFLGWVHFPDHRVLRTATKRRMIRKVGVAKTFETFQSYLGLLSHGNTHKLREQLAESPIP